MSFIARSQSQLGLLAALPRQAEKCRNLQNGTAAVVHLGFKAQLAAWADETLRNRSKTKSARLKVPSERADLSTGDQAVAVATVIITKCLF
jgi:hypothetical protein